MAAHRDHAATATAAPEQPTEQRPRMSTLTSAFAALPAEAVAHALPRHVVEDAQVGLLGDEPLRFWSNHALALASLGMLDPLRTVPHHTTDVEFVVQDAGTLIRRAVERR